MHQWSPEQIAGRLSYEHASWSISTNTIYRAVYAGKAGKTCLVTNVDRRSRFLKSRKIAVKRSEEVKNATIDLLKGEPLNPIPRRQRKGIQPACRDLSAAGSSSLLLSKASSSLGSWKQ